MKYGFGVDIGGTTVKIGLFSVDGKLLDKWEIPTNKKDNGKYILSDIANFINQMIDTKKINKEDIIGVCLGVFIPLIVVNCIILGRAEAFASKNGILDSALDGLGMGLGYTLAVLAMSFIRELISTGGIKVVNPFNEAQVWLNLHIIPENFTISVFGSSVGAFITFAVLAAAVGAYKQHVNAKEEAAAKEVK